MGREKSPTMSRSLALGVGGPLLAATLIVAPILLLSGSVPDPMNISWNSAGTPINPSSLGRFVGLQAVLAGLCSLGFAAAALALLPRPSANGILAVCAGAMSGLIGTNSLSTMLANYGQTSWTEAADPGVGWTLASVAGAGAGAVVVGRLSRRLFLTGPTNPVTEPSAGLALGETRSVLWHSGASSRPLRYASAALTVGAVAVLVMAIFGAGSIAAIVPALAMVAIGVGLLAGSLVTVSVDRRGLSVTYGRLRWPRTRIDLGSIASAEAIDVDPADHGGWGFSGSRRVVGKSAVVVRRGAGIRLGLIDGTEFVVTVDGAEQGVGVLNDLRHDAIGASR